VRVEELVIDDLEPKTVLIKGRDGRPLYLLREADEPATSKYRSAKAKTYRMVDGVPVGLNDGFGDLDRLLVSLCLCYLDGNGAPRLDPHGNAVKVPEHVVAGLHPAAVQRLAGRVREMSPWLEGGDETEESLTRQIAQLEGRLARLRGGEDPAKKARNGSTANSFTPAN
jgi:hypothetical protein